MTAENRIPVDMTFILAQDPSDKNNNMNGLSRHAVLTAMKKAMDFCGLTKYESLTHTDKNFHEELLKLNIPEVWMHDVKSDSWIGHCDNYYMVNFDDNSRIMFILIPPAYDEIQGDPMIQ